MGPTKDIIGMIDLPPLAVKLIRDTSATPDILFLLDQATRAMETTRNDKATNHELRTALNDISGVMPLLKAVLEKNGKIGLGDSMKIAMAIKNKGKYEKAGKAIAAFFEAGDPALANMVANLAKDDRVAATLRRLLPKALPPEGAALVQDPTVVKDLVVVLQEVEGALNETRTSLRAEDELKGALADVGVMLSLGRSYLETDKIPADTVAKIVLDASRYKKSGEALSAAQEAQNPALKSFENSLRTNEKIFGVLMKVVPRAQTMFKLGEDASGPYVIEGVTGSNIKIPLERDDYNDIQAVLAGKPLQPRKPKGPGAPGV